MSKRRRSIESLTLILNKESLSEFLTVKSIYMDSRTAILIDREYGEYAVDMKNLCPSMKTPLHKRRVHKNKMEAYRLLYVGKEINGFKILDVFYGPDRGYRNRSFYMEYLGKCGHVSISTKVHLLKHKKTVYCLSCAKTDHGERGKINGILKKRTSTYNHWVSIKKTLPIEYQEFSKFREAAGDKPYARAIIVIENGKILWINLSVTLDPDLSSIASAIRRTFRHSAIYNKAINDSRVETSVGPRYRCQKCKKLNKRKDIHVDHIEPIAALDGSALKKETLIDRIWTDKIQILDKTCHSKKSTNENKIRRANKIALKKRIKKV